MELNRKIRERRILFRVWNLLGKKEKRKIFLITLVQIALGFLDLIAVVVIGIIATISVTGFGVSGSSSKVDSFMELFRIENLSLQNQVAFLGSFALFALISRTAFSAYFTQRIISYLSSKGAQLSARAIAKTFDLPPLELQKINQQEVLFAVTNAPMYLYVGVIGSLSTVIADASLLLILIGGLMFVDFKTTFFTFLILGTASYLVYRLLRDQARALGQEITHVNVESNRQILEVLNSYRFIRVRNRTSHISQLLEKLRLQSGFVTGKIQFLPLISKYYVEVALILFAFGLATAQFLLEDAKQAISTLAIFFLAGSRIAPAALRIQQGALSIRNNLGIAHSSLIFLEELQQSDDLKSHEVNGFFENQDDLNSFTGDISLIDVSFKYPSAQNLALEDINLFIPFGSFTSVVGQSGSGKSTLADIILGIIEPKNGQVLISGLTPCEAIRKWTGSIAYVPQAVSLISGTIRENIVWGYDKSEFKDSEVIHALDQASLGDFVENLPDGLNTMIGENGHKLSGGQRQRLGIARALITKPKILILDEATSALDAVTEAEISNALRNLRGTVTLVVIAHRLSTVKLSDQVIYLKLGRLIDSGLFDELRERNSEFNSQALLMGL